MFNYKRRRKVNDQPILYCPAWQPRPSPPPCTCNNEFAENYRVDFVPLKNPAATWEIIRLQSDLVSKPTVSVKSEFISMFLLM